MFVRNILGILCLLGFAFCQFYGPYRMFKFRGQLEFPSNGTYTNIPFGSCLSITVKEEEKYSDFERRISCENTIKEFNFTGNVLEFEMMCKDFGTSLAISYRLNVGWCFTNHGMIMNDGLVRPGVIRRHDYHNNVAYIIPSQYYRSVVEMKMNASLYSEKVKCNLQQCNKNEDCVPDEYEMGHKCVCVGFDCPTSIRKPSDSVLTGEIHLPNYLYLDHFPKTCVYVWIQDVWEFFVEDYRVDYHVLLFEVPMAQLVRKKYLIYVMVKTGLPCSQFDKNTRRLEDYEAFGELITSGKNDTKLHIEVRERSHYQCGSQMCYPLQECTPNYPLRDWYCFCDVMNVQTHCEFTETKWLCSNTGQSYLNECYMKAHDCFRGYVKKEHDGKCIESIPKGWFHYKVNVISLVAGVIAICILIAALVVYIHRYRKQRKLDSAQACQQQVPFVYEDAIKKQPPQEEDEIKQEDKVADDIKFDDIDIDVPNGQPRVFELPPDNQETVSFDIINAYKA